MVLTRQHARYPPEIWHVEVWDSVQVYVIVDSTYTIGSYREVYEMCCKRTKLVNRTLKTLKCNFEQLFAHFRVILMNFGVIRMNFRVIRMNFGWSGWTLGWSGWLTIAESQSGLVDNLYAKSAVVTWSSFTCVSADEVKLWWFRGRPKASGQRNPVAL